VTLFSLTSDCLELRLPFLVSGVASGSWWQLQALLRESTRRSIRAQYFQWLRAWGCCHAPGTVITSLATLPLFAH